VTLPLGARLGAYEIVAALGAGGMGEVYRARDTRLSRDVAIKVLPATFVNDSDRRARFEREAQAVAALSHPNILAVYEFGVHEGQPFVAMELLDGESLRDRLTADGTPIALPVRKAVEIAIQIARGLAAAHDKQLIHRDLKPENVFLLRDGQVKILDFGLARSLVSPLGSGAAETVARTDPGTVLGTVGYMAPEQVRAGPLDARADLFALGAVLYEMLAGRRAFQRETGAETMTAILREDPPELAGSRPDLSPALDRIVRHALEKNPDERFQSARDVVFALSALSGSGSAMTAAMPAAAGAQPRARQWSIGLGTLAAGVVAALTAAAGGWWIGQRGAVAEARWEQFTQLTDQAGEESMPRISPDGSSFTYASRARGSWDIYVQRAGGRNPLLVAGDPVRHEAWPAFSPAGSQLAFNESDTDGGIFVIGATGESERRLTDFGANPAWSPDGRQIAFATEQVTAPYDRSTVSALWIVDAAGGTPRKIHDGDAVQPAWSPSGRRIAYWAVNAGQRDLFTIPVDGGERVALTNDVALDWAPVWSPEGEHVYFASDRGGSMALWRIAVDEATGQAVGAPESVTSGTEAAMELPSFSADGRTLLFRSQLRSVNPATIAFDPATERAGAVRLLLTRTGVLGPTSVSPDGAWIALNNQGERQEDLFLLKSDGTELRRLTDDGARDRMARWTPDGKALTFYSNRGGRYAGWSIRPDGSGLTQIAAVPDADMFYPVISPADGRLSISTSANSYLLDPPFPASPDRVRALPNLVGGEAFLGALWSPDGRWLSGASISGGGALSGVAVYDVAAGQAHIISRDLGVWSAPFLPDSRRLIYLTENGALVVVDVPGGARRVIPVTLPFGPALESLAVAPDGRTLYYGALQIESNVWKVDRGQ
jgi:Tol biopolymer transport system component